MREQSRKTMMPHCFSAWPFLRQRRHSMATERHSCAMWPSSLHLKQARAEQSWWWCSPRQYRHFACSRSYRQFFAMCPRFPQRKHFTRSRSSSAPAFARLSKYRTARPCRRSPSSSPSFPSPSAAAHCSPSFSACFCLSAAALSLSSAIFLRRCSRYRSLTYLVDSLPSMRQVKSERASVCCMGFSRVFSSTASSLRSVQTGSTSTFLRRSMLKTLQVRGVSAGGRREGLRRAWTGMGRGGSSSEEEISMGFTVSFCLRCCFSLSLAFFDFMSDLPLRIIKELILQSSQQDYCPNSTPHYLNHANRRTATRAPTASHRTPFAIARCGLAGKGEIALLPAFPSSCLRFLLPCSMAVCLQIGLILTAHLYCQCLFAQRTVFRRSWTFRVHVGRGDRRDERLLRRGEGEVREEGEAGGRHLQHGAVQPAPEVPLPHGLLLLRQDRGPAEPAPHRRPPLPPQVLLRQVQRLLPGALPRGAVLLVGGAGRRGGRGRGVPGLARGPQPAGRGEVPRALLARAPALPLRARVPGDHQRGHHPAHRHRAQGPRPDREGGAPHRGGDAARDHRPRGAGSGGRGELRAGGRGRQAAQRGAPGRGRPPQGGRPQQLHLPHRPPPVDPRRAEVRQGLREQDGDRGRGTHLHHARPARGHAARRMREPQVLREGGGRGRLRLGLRGRAQVLRREEQQARGPAQQELAARLSLQLRLPRRQRRQGQQVRRGLALLLRRQRRRLRGARAPGGPQRVQQLRRGEPLLQPAHRGRPQRAPRQNDGRGALRRQGRTPPQGPPRRLIPFRIIITQHHDITSHILPPSQIHIIPHAYTSSPQIHRPPQIHIARTQTSQTTKSTLLSVTPPLNARPSSLSKV